MLQQLTLVLASGLLVNGLRFDGPRPTDAVLIPDLTASKPPASTPGPYYERRDGQPNQPPTICGYIGGTGSIIATCSTNSECVWHTDYSIVGCCNTAQPFGNGCVFYTDCVDFRPVFATVNDSPDIYTCKGTKTCYKNAYPSNYGQWGCGYNATTVLLTAENQPLTAATIHQVFLGTKEILSVQATTVTAAAVTVTASSTPAKAKANAGAFAGAAIGGLVVGAAIAAAAVCLLFRRKQKGSVVTTAPAPGGHENSPPVYHHVTQEQPVNYPNTTKDVYIPQPAMSEIGSPTPSNAQISHQSIQSQSYSYPPNGQISPSVSQHGIYPSYTPPNATMPAVPPMPSEMDSSPAVPHNT